MRSRTLCQYVVQEVLKIFLPVWDSHAGEQSREFVAVDADDEGQCWRLHLSIRSNGYRKPVISGGWMKFVRDKNVQIGDAVWFSKEYYYDQATATQMMRYRVRVTREIQILGVWHVAVVP
ncbi:hypothetical protein WN944_015301 [Citrus x changshan-huyou]|uniref:TF-B3 domain-containing protein n=1 Tax=Citrus x changshan-huyou TaxID=2935761 RepID=A0AAP0QLM0_9ROSI